MEVLRILRFYLTQSLLLASIFQTWIDTFLSVSVFLTCLSWWLVHFYSLSIKLSCFQKERMHLKALNQLFLDQFSHTREPGFPVIPNDVATGALSVLYNDSAWVFPGIWRRHLEQRPCLLADSASWHSFLCVSRFTDTNKCFLEMSYISATKIRFLRISTYSPRLQNWKM